MTLLWIQLILFLAVDLGQASVQIKCRDNSTYCPTGSTCCPLDANTRYGCCPIPDAVCCEDLLHCCPNGMVCDTAHGQCVNGKVRLPMNKKVSSEEEHREKSDHKYGILLESTQRECRNGDVCKGESTCCHDPITDEAYCCPTSKAKCCKEAKTCCPHGFRCSSYGESCIREKHGVVITMQMFDANLAEEGDNTREEMKRKRCPDSSLCPPGNTCCPSNNDNNNANDKSYSCCPSRKAHCCDGFCCPRGYTCSENKHCKKKKNSYDLFN